MAASLLPDSAKSLTDVTEDNRDFLPIIFSFAEQMVGVKQWLVMESPEMNPDWRGV